MTNDFSKFFMKVFGIRTVKTGLATAIALYIAMSFDLRMPVMAGLSAIVTMKTSIFDSFKVSKFRLIATIVGGLIGSLFKYIGFVGFFPLIIGIVVVINLCNYFKWKDSTTLSIMVFVMIMIYEGHGENPMPYWEYGLHRLFDTFVGLVIGLLVNYFILRPNQGEFILKTYQKSLFECEQALKDILVGKEIFLDNFISDIHALNSDLENIRNDGKMGSKYYFKLYKLSKMNAHFFTAFGLLAQLADDKCLPIITDENKKSLNNYFNEEIKTKSQICPLNYEENFNFYLEDLINLLIELREKVEELKQLIEKDKEENLKPS